MQIIFRKYRLFNFFFKDSRIIAIPDRNSPPTNKQCFCSFPLFRSLFIFSTDPFIKNTIKKTIDRLIRNLAFPTTGRLRRNSKCDSLGLFDLLYLILRGNFTSFYKSLSKSLIWPLSGKRWTTYGYKRSSMRWGHFPFPSSKITSLICRFPLSLS